MTTTEEAMVLVKTQLGLKREGQLVVQPSPRGFEVVLVVDGGYRYASDAQWVADGMLEQFRKAGFDVQRGTDRVPSGPNPTPGIREAL